MEPKRRRPSSPLTAGCDAGSCKKTGDSPQEQKEELNEGRDELCGISLENQTSMSEKQMTADEKFSEGFQDKLPRTNVIRFNDYSYPDSLSFQSPLDNVSEVPLPSYPLFLPEGSQYKQINSAHSHSGKSLHEMSDEARLLSGASSAQRQPLFGLRNSPWNPYERSLRSRTGPVVDQGFTDISGESLKKDVIGFLTQSEQMSADDKFSEGAVLEKMLSTSVSNYSPSVPLFFQGPLDNDSWISLSSEPSFFDARPIPHQKPNISLSVLDNIRSNDCQLSTNDESDDGVCYEFYENLDETIQNPASRFIFTRSQASDQILNTSNREDTDDDVSSFDTVIIPNLSQSKAPSFPAPPPAQSWPIVLQESTVFAEGSRVRGWIDRFDLLSVQSESESGGDSNVLGEMEAPVQAVNYLTTNVQTSSSDPGWTERGSRCLTRSHSFPSRSQKTSAKTFRRSHSLPDMKLKTSVEEFTPDITADEDDETFSFQCSCPGLYQCSVTGLVFHMEGGGDVVYRIVPWNRRLLAQHHKQPAGPLFDIKCLQQSVCRLHLPHCEIRSTGEFLSVAHVNDEDIEFIGPHEVTETHVIINITGFSAFGNVKDEDSPPDPVQALVLLFYRPPADPDPYSVLKVLLLPRNVVFCNVVRWRKKFIGDERYIETSPHCKLHPKQKYTLSTCPEDSVQVEPKEAEFDETSYDNYFPSFQVDLETVMKHIQLVLRDQSSHSVWERRVCLSSTGVKRSCGPSALNLPPDKKLLDIRSSFIDGISGPVLKSLLDKLFEKKVMTDSERESANDIQNKRDKARFVIDTVRKKGEAASSEMIEFLCEVDPFLCEHLDLI